MDIKKISKPVVMAKPVRGREMQSTAIPKDVIETVEAVSAKQIRGKSIVDNLQKPREGDVEVYHEGYVDGKLYLVPDTNLQAMRDIVNLKMKRRQSSAEKHQTSLDEPTQYIEFKTKLDCLLEKIDQLAESSSDETQNVEESVNSKKSLKSKENKGLRKQSEKAKTTHKTSSLLILRKEIEKKFTESELLNTSKIVEKRVIIPPMLDENISYISVRPKDHKQSGKPLKDLYSLGLQQEAMNDREMTYIKNKLEEFSKEQSLDKFKLLISGHLNDGVDPTFIVHQNYAGLNILETDPPDFKTHKKEGNIEIFISGKFFTGSILKEESSESPAVLDIKPNKRKKFKDIYKVGPLEVALEGEFKKDSNTLKYTPVFSLKIIKSSLDVGNILLENKNDTEPSTNVFYSRQNYHTPFINDKDHIEKDGPMTSKHVHYGSGNREPHDDVNSKRGECATNKKILSLLKKNMIYKKLFPKANRTQSDGSLVSEAVSSSSMQIKARSSKMKREELARLRKSRLKERRGKRGHFKELYNTHEKRHSYTSNPKMPSNQLLKNKHEAKSSFEVQSRPTPTDKILDKISESNMDKKKVKMVKKKKKDKNQAIVENPILAQMQEFFIA